MIDVAELYIKRLKTYVFNNEEYIKKSELKEELNRSLRAAKPFLNKSLARWS
jgi:hypothetical protein